MNEWMNIDYEYTIDYEYISCSVWCVRAPA